MAEADRDRRPRLYLVDGSGYIFRAYHALPPLTRKSDGLPTGAVAGFCNMLNKLLDDARADGGVGHLAVIFDTARKTFRSEIYPEYKAHRPPPPEDLVPQFPLMRDATRAFSVPCIEREGFEADDLIATYARLGAAAGYDVVVVSSDKDLMQLVGPHVEMRDPMKQTVIDADAVRAKFGVGPDRVVDVQALAGDSSDNVPGVPGIGVKTAAELINTYGDLDTLLARAEEIRQPKRRQTLIENAEMARVSRELVRLRDDVPVDDGIDALAIGDPDPDTLFGFLDAMEFATLAARLRGRLAKRAGGAAAASAAVATPPIGAGVVPAAGDAPAPDADLGAPRYVAVQDEATLRAWIERATAAGVVTVDTETTSLDVMRAELVGVSLSIAPGAAAYIPLGHRAPEAQPGLSFDLEAGSGPEGGEGGGNGAGGAAPVQIPRDRALELLRPLLSDPGVLKVGQNIKYDMAVLARHGVAITPVDDTMLLSFVLEAGLHGHGMDELSELHLGHRPITFKDVAGTGKAQVTFDRVPLDRAVAYAAEDADITNRLHRLLKPRLVAEHLVSVYETIERPLVPVLVDMERAGIRVDPERLATLSRDFAGRMADLEAEIHRLAGREFNVASPKQLGEVLFDEMGLAGGKKGKTGAYATGADVLEDLAAQGHDLPARVLDWRQLAKLKGTYTDALQGQVDPATGRVHTSFLMAAASTGRLASSDPNLQNIPVRTEEGRRIRQAFVPAEGHRLLSADYSQIELRLLAHVADIGALKEAFRSGADIHALTASEVFGVAMADMDPGVRRSAKAINFGIIYGISPFGLARQLGIAQGEAKAYIDAYFERYPGIRDYMDRTRAAAREAGYVTTLFGRRVHIPTIRDKNPARRAFGERAAINAPLQGAAADIIKRAMARVPAALARDGLGARMLLQVHDELLFEVPEDEVEATGAVVRRVMEGAAHLDVPLTVDIGVGGNWDEAH
jgi:DNA polymerase-1